MEWVAVSIATVIIVALVAAYHIVRMALGHEEKRMGIASGQGAPADVQRLEQILAATQAEVTKLRDRVQVLERLATDDDRRLAGEIDRLRSAEEARR